MKTVRHNHLSQFTKCVTARPVNEVDIIGLVEAAKLYLDGKVGEDAFTCLRNGVLEYKFTAIPVMCARLVGTIEAAALIFGNNFGLKVGSFFPYLLVNLCGDLLDEASVDYVKYSPRDCGYSMDENGLVIRLLKHIDYCSYHEIALSFTTSEWIISIKGCWSGSQQDPGPVYYPTDISYTGCISGNMALSPVIESKTFSGENPDKCFALWGVDLEKIGIKMDYVKDVA